MLQRERTNRNEDGKKNELNFLFFFSFSWQFIWKSDENLLPLLALNRFLIIIIFICFFFFLEAKRKQHFGEQCNQKFVAAPIKCQKMRGYGKLDENKGDQF